MERLTTRCSGYAVMAWEHEEKHTTQEWIDMLTDRLAAYEDSGLEPEDVRRLQGDWTSLIMALDEMGGMPHLHDLLQDEKDGKLVVLPCKVGEYWRDWNGERVRIESVSFSFIRRHLCNTDMVTYRYDDEEDDFAVNWIYFKSHFTHEEAEAALVKKGDSEQ